MNREAIYSALFTLLQAGLTGLGVVTVSRRGKHWVDVAADQQPAVYQVQRSEISVPDLPDNQTKWVLELDIYVYVHTAEPNPPSQVLNPIIDAVQQCFKVDNADTQACTLGGLVTHAVIDGRIDTSEGLLGNQEVAIIPVKLLVFDSGGA